jgi:hypothetical protein
MKARRRQPGLSIGIPLMGVAGLTCFALGVMNSLSTQTLGRQITVFFFFLAAWSAVEIFRLSWIRRVVAAGGSPLDSRGLAVAAVVEGVVFGAGVAYQLDSSFGFVIGAAVACLGAAPLFVYAARLRPSRG